MEGNSKSIAGWMALGALFLIPLTPLIVANTFFFPFITGKAFFFRVLVEIAFAGWIVLAFLDRSYRPRFSWVGVCAFGFVFWMFIANLFAPNVAKAFWSNFERMEGWVLLIHLLGFFVAMSTVLRVEDRWRTWFLTSLGVSVLVIFHALFQILHWLPIHQGSSRIDASFGNSAYLAIYLLFNVFIAGWLALTEKEVWLKRSLYVLAVVEAILIFFTGTRGTALGLVGALVIAAFLYAFTTSGRTRRIGVGALIGLCVLVGGFVLVRNVPAVQQSVVGRIASISLSDGTTRFTIWHMAWDGFLARPLTGWGQEGFNYVFNTYYNPSLYEQEPWFDRAHNAFIDWLSAGGLLAFLLYIGLFVSAVYALWKGPLPHSERIALTCVLVAYAFHNMFVFDNLFSYVYFFAILALIDSQVGIPLKRFETWPVFSETKVGTLVFPIVGAGLVVALITVNYFGIRTAMRLVTAITPSSQGVGVNIAALADLDLHPSFVHQEISEQIVSFALSASQSTAVSGDLKKQLADLAVSSMSKQVAQYPQDAREHLELSLAYQIAGDAQNAFKELEAARVLSPRKEQILLQEGSLLLDAGDVKAVQSAFSLAYSLGPQFNDLALYAAAGDILAGEPAKGKELLQKTFGTSIVDSDVLGLAYYRTKDYPNFIALWELRAHKPGAPASAYFGLAGAYYLTGQKQKAIDTVNAAVVAHPEVSAQAAAALQEIQQGK